MTKKTPALGANGAYLVINLSDEHVVIDTSTHVAVPRMTVEQLGKLFKTQFGDDYTERRGTAEWFGWLACARALGVVKEET